MARIHLSILKRLFHEYVYCGFSDTVDKDWEKIINAEDLDNALRVARALLSVLAEAGLLVDPGGEAHTGAETGFQGPLDGCAHAAADSTGRPPRVDGADIIRDLRRQLVAARQETARVRSQLAEARDALVRVAATLGWDAPPEQVPSGIPDLTIAVQELRRQRDQARAVLAEARQERDQARSDVCGAAAEADDARRDIDNLRDGLIDALEMGHATDDDDIIREAAACNHARTEAVALRSERDQLRAVYEPLRAQVTDWHARLRAMWLPAAMGAIVDLREEMGAALGSTLDTGSTHDQPA